MKRLGHDPRPAVIERRYNDFCFIYECILKSFHPSILGEFLFPKKVLIGNFKAEVISERKFFCLFPNLSSAWLIINILFGVIVVLLYCLKYSSNGCDILR